ncbi:SgcJ/EcaC family oxidoreductase [Lyngbya aestuarii]|uniref:SgcJ/EcaC family oxidoreductase n=1 Tax=Lyngbya aestuarii TaxID=118322 RepID=UPI00403E11EC
MDIAIMMLSPAAEIMNQNIKEIVTRQALAWETANANKIIADFAEDGLFVTPGATFQGKQQIKEAVESYFAEFTDTKVKIKRIISNGNQAAVEWDWSEKNKKTGEISRAEDAIIFEVAGGKIKSWREYIDQKSPSD